MCVMLFYRLPGLGRDSSISIDSLRAGAPGIESRSGARFYAPVHTGPGAHPASLYNGYRVSFPGVKWPGRGVNHTPRFSGEVKESVELYLYASSGPSWRGTG